MTAEVNRELIAKGSDYQGLPTFLGTAPRPALAHSTWSDRLMQKGDWLAYEIGEERADVATNFPRHVHII